jgi:hypothetical protein
MLEQRHDFTVSRETLRRWMSEAGIWRSRKERRSFHQPRLRREYFGELIQIDGSDHRWFEDRGPRCTLLVFIDDATSTLMQLRFVKSESTFSYFEALELYLAAHGRPVAFYSDKHKVSRVPKTFVRNSKGTRCLLATTCQSGCLNVTGRHISPNTTNCRTIVVELSDYFRMDVV